MRVFVVRVLKSGLPVAVFLAAIGYGLAQMAEMMVGAPERPHPDAVPTLTDHLRYRLPLGLAAWGFGLVLGFEMLFGLWRKPAVVSEVKPAAAIPDETEQLLLKLLAEADAAEQARRSSVADDTPPPRGAVPAGHFLGSGLANTPR